MLKTPDIRLVKNVHITIVASIINCTPITLQNQSRRLLEYTQKNLAEILSKDVTISVRDKLGEGVVTYIHYGF